MSSHAAALSRAVRVCAATDVSPPPAALPVAVAANDCCSYAIVLMLIHPPVTIAHWAARALLYDDIQFRCDTVFTTTNLPLSCTPSLSSSHSTV